MKKIIPRTFGSEVLAAFTPNGLEKLRSTLNPILHAISDEKMDDLHEQQYALVGVLSLVAASDRFIDERERDFLARLFPEIDIEKAIKHFSDETVQLAEVAQRLNKKEKALICLLAYAMAHADGELHERERSYLTRLTRMFNMSSDEVQAVVKRFELDVRAHTQMNVT